MKSERKKTMKKQTTKLLSLLLVMLMLMSVALTSCKPGPATEENGTSEVTTAAQTKLELIKEGNSNNEISKKLNCSQQVYSNYELGQRDIPTDILIKLSMLYGVSVDYILGITDNPIINK